MPEVLGSISGELRLYVVRRAVDEARQKIVSGKASEPPAAEMLLKNAAHLAEEILKPQLKPVINATGIVVHTNLGRAPFGRKMLQSVAGVISGYSNLEFDLDTGVRGSRNRIPESKIRFLTGAEDVLVVNNNAAAVMLILGTFARGREVIVSRGELIEIGGSFRLPEIMAASGAVMKEVGATNKTHLRDYENAVNEHTAMLFKAHRSNYEIKGFTAEVGLEELSRLGKKHHLPVVYDMGSGLLRPIGLPLLDHEPTVRDTLKQGADLVTFSGDKLIGGPQAGIIAGKASMIAKLKKAPMLRALRAGKTTLAFLETALSWYFDSRKLFKHNQVFGMLHQTPASIKRKAEKLQALLKKEKIRTEVVESCGYCGGGAAPGRELPSYAVRVIPPKGSRKQEERWSEQLYFAMMQAETPVVGILRQGKCLIDLFTVMGNELEKLSGLIVQSVKEVQGNQHDHNHQDRR